MVKGVKIYETKPCMIQAIEFDGCNHEDIFKWTDGKVVSAKPWKDAYLVLEIKTLEGTMDCLVGDFIIKGLRGEFYPCKPDVFHQKYRCIEQPEKETE